MHNFRHLNLGRAGDGYRDENQRRPGELGFIPPLMAGRTAADLATALPQGYARGGAEGVGMVGRGGGLVWDPTSPPPRMVAHPQGYGGGEGVGWAGGGGLVRDSSPLFSGTGRVVIQLERKRGGAGSEL